MSFTERAVVERRKTVTRRKGWQFLKPGDRLTLCRKVQGRAHKDGEGRWFTEPLVKLAEVEVISVRRERLNVLRERADCAAELAREGFDSIDANELMRAESRLPARCRHMRATREQTPSANPTRYPESRRMSRRRLTRRERGQRWRGRGCCGGSGGVGGWCSCPLARVWWESIVQRAP
jgi:hypothetical protein